MNDQQLQELATRLNMNLAFIQRLKNRMKINDQVDLVKAINDVKMIQNETNGTEDDAIEFYASRKETSESAPKTTQEVATQPQTNQTLQQVNTQLENTQATPSGQTLSTGAIQIPQTQAPTQPQTSVQPPVIEQMPAMGQQQAQGAIKIPQEMLKTLQAQQPQRAPGAPFKKDFGDVKNPTVRGVGVGGSVGVVDAMLGRRSYVTQTYANYNPKIEPTAGGRNWGTDFRGNVGDKLNNPFKSDLEVVKAIDGHGDGNLKNRDNGGFGNQIVVRRTDTGEVLDMAHLNKGSLRGLKPGDRIKPGEQIAEIGKSGNVSGSHVSLEAFDADGRVKDTSDIQPIDENTPNVSRGADDSVVYEQKSYTPQQQKEPEKRSQEDAVVMPPGEAKLPAADKALEKEVQKEESAVKIPQSLEDKIISQLPEEQRENARKALPDIASALQTEGILTPKVLSYAMVTAGHESGFVPKEEKMAQRGINPRNDYIAGLQENYSGGKDFKGRGFIQLTHDYNYKKYGDRIGEDLVNNPNKLLDPKVSAKVLAAYFKDNGVAQAAETDDLITARKKVQGSGATNAEFMANTQEMANKSKQMAQSLEGENFSDLTNAPQDQPIKDTFAKIEETPVTEQPIQKTASVLENMPSINQEPKKSFLNVFVKPPSVQNIEKMPAINETSTFKSAAMPVGQRSPQFSNLETMPTIDQKPTLSSAPVLQKQDQTIQPARQQAQMTPFKSEKPDIQPAQSIAPAERFKNVLEPLTSAAKDVFSTFTQGKKEDIPESLQDRVVPQKPIQQMSSQSNQSIQPRQSVSSPSVSQSRPQNIQQRIANAVQNRQTQTRVAQSRAPQVNRMNPAPSRAPQTNRSAQGGRQQQQKGGSGGRSSGTNRNTAGGRQQKGRR